MNRFVQEFISELEHRTMPPLEMPGISSIEESFETTVAPIDPHMPISSEAKFKRRLAVCRQCPLWLETEPFQTGACGGSTKLIWREPEQCPENLWVD